MPRKTQTKSRTQPQSQSQSQSQSQTQQSQTATEHGLGSCLTETPANIDDQVNNCIRYILQKFGNKLPFRKSDLQKHAITISSRSNFEVVIQKVGHILKEVYGFNLLLCEGTSSNRSYILSNALPYIPDDTEDGDEPPEDVGKILLLLVLSHIFMFGLPVGEASLNSFLLSFGVDVERNHTLFGNVKDCMNTMVKQKYLHVETDPITKKCLYSWGPRANVEISKHAVLDFVCKMYKNCTPKHWTNQYKMAEEQGFENLPLPNDLNTESNSESMDVDLV